MAAPPPADDGGSPPRGALDERPPFLTWPKIYAIVVGALALQVVIYAVLSRVMR
jgi:hypothetical protein